MTDTWQRACTETGNCLEWRPAEDGSVEIRNNRQPDTVIRATWAEIDALVVDRITSALRGIAQRHTAPTGGPT